MKVRTATLTAIAFAVGGAAAVLLILFSATWLRARYARLSSRQILGLQFEEAAEPVVQLLRIDRD